MSGSFAYLVLDTNILPIEGDLQSVKWLSVKRICDARNISICLPGIVIEESVGLRERAASDAVSAIKKAGKELKSLGVDLPFDESIIDDIVPHWERQLRDFASIAGHRDEHATEALTREARRIAPARDGKGGRDALVWLTVAQFVGENSVAYFVTNNHKDFGKGVLLDSLKEDLGEWSECVNYYNRLDSFLESISEPAAETVFDANAASGEIISGLRRWLLGEEGNKALAGLAWSAEDTEAGELDVFSLKRLKDMTVDAIGLQTITGEFSVSRSDSVQLHGRFLASVTYEHVTGDWIEVSIDLRSSLSLA